MEEQGKEENIDQEKEQAESGQENANGSNEKESSQEKKRYIEKMIDQLRKWDVEIQKLEAKASNAGAGLKAKYDEQIKELREKKGQSEGKLHDLGNAGGEAWNEVKEGFEKSWNILGEAFKAAWGHFQDKREETKEESKEESKEIPKDSDQKQD